MASYIGRREFLATLGVGAPKVPADLSKLACITFDSLTSSATWRFVAPGSRTERAVSIHSRLSVIRPRRRSMPQQSKSSPPASGLPLQRRRRMVQVCAKLSKNILLTIVSAENCKEETIVSAESL
jgi:hypothetical protein